jgi:hypothetical protein
MRAVRTNVLGASSPLSRTTLYTAPEGGHARFSAEGAEERAQGLARLFVAMMRARDLLFLTASVSPIVELQRAEKLLEWRV